MNQVFADTGYWIAVLFPRDDLHLCAKQVVASLGEVQIVTSEWVLTEVLDSFAERGTFLRQGAARLVAMLASHPDVLVISYGEVAFQQASELYRQRLDKNWSVTDCSSFLIMERLGIIAALSHDRHFEQANFKALLRVEMSS